MIKKSFVLAIATLVGLSTIYFYSRPRQHQMTSRASDQTVATKFAYLSQNGNSACSLSFKNSISQMDRQSRLQGSCCSQMTAHRYNEQVEGLKKYANFLEIPPDPYDIEANLAQDLMAYYDLELSPQEQQTYDFAMQSSHEKGPCCCRCWRWFVYGGLAKYLIKTYGATGEQITEIWNLSDGCGGDEHLQHT